MKYLLMCIPWVLAWALATYFQLPGYWAVLVGYAAGVITFTYWQDFIDAR